MARREDLSPRERVLRNCRFQRCDRFSIDYHGCPEVSERLRAWYGVETQDDLLASLHVDFRYPWPQYIGPKRTDRDGRPADCFGITRAGVGSYGYPVDHPLANVASVGEVESYPWPTADMWDYDAYTEECASLEGYAVVGGAWQGFFAVAAQLVGMERLFYLLHDRPEIVHAILGKLVDLEVRMDEIILQKAARHITILYTGEDLGTQKGPLLSGPMLEEFIWPYLQRVCMVGKRYGKLVMHHSCGSVGTLIPRLLQLGIDVLEPVQVRAAGMDPVGLAQSYGGKLCFHGAIDTQETLPFGTPDDVRREVRQRVETFRPFGGYTIGPSQSLLPEVPTENIVALYEAAMDCAWMD